MTHASISVTVNDEEEDGDNDDDDDDAESGLLFSTSHKLNLTAFNSFDDDANFYYIF